MSSCVLPAVSNTEKDRRRAHVCGKKAIALLEQWTLATFFCFGNGLLHLPLSLTYAAMLLTLREKICTLIVSDLCLFSFLLLPLLLSFFLSLLLIRALLSASSVSVLDCSVTLWKSALDWHFDTSINRQFLAISRQTFDGSLLLTCFAQSWRVYIGMYWVCLNKHTLQSVGMRLLNLYKLKVWFINEDPFLHFSGAFKQILRGLWCHYL